MNVERWLKARTPYWQKLEDLLRLVDKKGLQSLDRQQLQELGRLYRSSSADLSRARAMKLSQDVQVYLNNLVVKAHNQVYQTEQNRWKDLVTFFWSGFPGLVRKYILYVVLSFFIFAVPLAVAYSYAQSDLHFAQMETFKGQPLVSEEMMALIEQKKMWTDPAEKYSAEVSGMIATNNMRVSIMAFVCGITFGIGSAVILLINGLNVGTILGVCHEYGMAGRLLTFMAPHGVIELTAIFISGGAGLLMGRALLFPGQYKRSDAFRLIGKDACGLFAGCLPLLLIAGSIEGFISPRTDLDPNIKFAVSLATLVCLMLYLFAPRSKNSA